MLQDLIKKIAKDSLVYGIGNGLTRFIQLFTLPIIAKALSVQQFGDWNLLALTASVLSAVMIFGLDSAIIRFFYDNESVEYRKRLFSSGLILMILLSAALALLFWQISLIVLATLSLSTEYEASYKITVFWMPGMALQMYLLNWFKWTLQKFKFILITFGFVTISLLLLLYLQVTNQLSVQSILMSATISQWVAVLLGLAMAWKYFTLDISLALLKKVVPYGIPFMLVMLTGALRGSLDRFILAEFTGDNNQLVGLYSMGQRLGMFMNFFVFTLDIAISPLIFSNWNNPDAPITFGKLQRYYLLIINWVAICLSAGAVILVKILATDEYLPVIAFFPILLISNYVLGLYMFASIGVSFSKKSYLNTFSLFISLAVLYISAFYLTPRYFAWGVSIAFLLSILSMVVSGYVFSRRHYYIKYHWKGDVITVLIGTLLCFLAVNLKVSQNYLINSILVLIAVNGLYLGYVRLALSKSEVVQIKKYIKKWLTFR